MNTEETKALQFNFETLTIERIEDRSISIEKTYGSTINSGQIAGDAVNNV